MIDNYLINHNYQIRLNLTEVLSSHYLNSIVIKNNLDENTANIDDIFHTTYSIELEYCYKKYLSTGIYVETGGMNCMTMYLPTEKVEYFLTWLIKLINKHYY